MPILALDTAAIKDLRARDGVDALIVYVAPASLPAHEARVRGRIAEAPTTFAKRLARFSLGFCFVFALVFSGRVAEVPTTFAKRLASSSV